MSNRKTITAFLENLLYEEKLCGMGMYWAKEVVVDYGSSKAKTKRIDFMQYIPDGQCSISSLEKGIFESKSNYCPECGQKLQWNDKE